MVSYAGRRGVRRALCRVIRDADIATIGVGWVGGRQVLEETDLESRSCIDWFRDPLHTSP
jgi:hypothetical protein